MLRQAALRFDIPVEDLARAKQFYADKLGLKPTHENGFSAQYRYADSHFVLTPAASAGRSESSLLTWLVPDLKETKSLLETQGVRFEDYDLGFAKTEDGVMSLDGDLIAWFKDSEGNLLAIAQTR